MSLVIRRGVVLPCVCAFALFCTPQTNAVDLNASSILSPAGAVRITRSGLDALASSVGPLTASALGAMGSDFVLKVPSSNTTLPIGPITAAAEVCPPTLGGTCTLHIDLAQAEARLDGVAPNVLATSIQAPIRLDDLTLRIQSPLSAQAIIAHVGYGIGTCVAGKPNVVAVSRPLRFSLPFAREGRDGRAGLSRVDTARASVDASGLNANDVVLCADCGANDPGGICQAIVSSSAVRTAVTALIMQALPAAVQPALDQALCVQPVTSPSGTAICPGGSRPNTVGNRCVFKSEPTICVQRPLGSAQRLPALPPSRTDIDGLFALSGALDPAPSSPADNTPYPGHTPNGLSWDLAVGARVGAVSPCVLPANLPSHPKLTSPAALHSATLPQGSADNAHFAVAFARGAIEFALFQAQQGGALCRDITSLDTPFLSAVTLGIVLPSLTKLGRTSSTPIMMRIRPTRPPKLTLPGDDHADATLGLAFDDFTIDVHVWIDARYVRVMTFQADLSVTTTLELKTENGAPVLKPKVGNIRTARAHVTNSELLTESPATIAATFAGLLQTVASQLVGSALPTLNLNDLLGPLGNVLRDLKLTKLHQDDDDYILVSGHFGGMP